MGGLEKNTKPEVNSRITLKIIRGKKGKPKKPAKTSNGNVIPIRTPVKSDFEERMEREGWELLMNESLFMEYRDCKFNRIKGAYDHSGSKKTSEPLSLEEIKARFNGIGFRDVNVCTQAYDIYDNPLEGLVAVYVKK